MTCYTLVLESRWNMSNVKKRLWSIMTVTMGLIDVMIIITLLLAMFGIEF